MPTRCPQCGKEHATLEELQAREIAKEPPMKLRIKKISMTSLKEPE